MKRYLYAYKLSSGLIRRRMSTPGWMTDVEREAYALTQLAPDEGGKLSEEVFETHEKRVLDGEFVDA